MTREPVYAALFDLIRGLSPLHIKTCSRRLLHWADVEPENQPAIFMTQGNQTAEHQAKTLPFKWELDVKLYVYVRVSDDESPAPVINPILDAIEEILKPGVGRAQTLNGLCDVCYIDGAIETFEGTLGSQEVAIVPIKILVR